MRKIFILLILFTLLLSGCGTFEIYLETTPEADPAMPAAAATVEPKLSINSTSEQIQLAMLESATRWKSIWMDGTVTNFAMPKTDSQTTTTREQVWIDLTTNRFRVLSGEANGYAQQFLTSDGFTILKMDLVSGKSESYSMPDFARVGQFVPTLQPGTATPQPLWGQIGTPLSQLAFTSDFAQNEGTFKPISTEFIADRETLIVDWTYIQSNLPSWRMWLDTSTAVIVKMQSFDKGGGDSIRSEVVLNQVSFDDVFADSLFGMPGSLPQFSDLNGQPLEAVGTGANAPGGRDALGELYFFEVPAPSSQTIELVRMSGLCVVGEAECPQIERVVSSIPLINGLPNFSWSPDGNYAAFAYPESQESTPYKLWLFDPAANTWTSLWEHAYIDQPLWSPDGEWLAFRQFDGLGGEDMMVIRRDGSEPKNLTIGSQLPQEGRPYVLDGWITGHLIVHSSTSAQIGEAYLVNVADGHVQSMLGTLQTKAIFVPSHDGAWIAYDDYDNSTAIHSIKVAEPDAANAVTAATFTGGSLFPIVWSPDNQQIAFVYYTESAQGTQIADVYVIDRNGQDLKQVYSGTIVGAVLFSPDGRYLLINEASSPTGGRLFTVNLETLEQRLVQSPGLTLETNWFMPTWRK